MKRNTFIAAGLGVAAMIAAPVSAQQTDMQAWQQWQRSNNETVSADRMMTGDVTNAFNMLGNVEDLILNERGTQIEYVLYEVPYPYSAFGSEDGFVRWDNVAVERGFGTGVDLRIDNEASSEAKDRLQLTRKEARGRLVSRIVGGDMMFADGSMREIDDILFDPASGLITHFVVEMSEDSLFDEDTRRIPASMVSLDANGRWMVSQPAAYEWEVWVY